MEFVQYTQDAQQELATLQDRTKKADALRILEAQRIRLSSLADPKGLNDILMDTERAVWALYPNARVSDPHIVLGVALNLHAAARKALLDPEVN